MLLVLHFCLCYAVLSVPCSLVVTCWERAALLALLFVLLSCVFVTFPYGVPGQVLYLIVSIPDLCLLLYLGSRLETILQCIRVLCHMRFETI